MGAQGNLEKPVSRSARDANATSAGPPFSGPVAKDLKKNNYKIRDTVIIHLISETCSGLNTVCIPISGFLQTFC